MAGADSTKTIMGPLEIVSVTGTLGAGSHHIHLSVSNNDGTVFGGHLVDGCTVFTTVELVVMDLSGDWKFNRRGDARTGYPELDPTKCSPT
jgi:predicted DNA-binding protein with PD1-like motif